VWLVEAVLADRYESMSAEMNVSEPRVGVEVRRSSRLRSSQMMTALSRAGS
jgi:hypothetical protein